MKRWMALVYLLSLGACMDAGNVCTQTGNTYSCDDKVPAPAPLVGSFKFVYLDLNYLDGSHQRYDSATTTGTYDIRKDGSFTQVINYNGKVTTISNVMKSITTISPTQWEITGGGETDRFEIRNDTMIQTLDVPKASDPKGIGFTESDYFVKTK